MSVVVAATFLPQLVADVARVRANRRLRGRRETGVRGFAAASMPVLHGAMDRSITLAAAMDSRGYGRAGHRSPAERALSTAALLAGLVFATIGVYGLLGTGAATWWGPALVVVGIASATTSLVLAGRRSIRTRYRPNAWSASDIGTAAIGVVVAGLFLMAAAISPETMTTSTSPPMWPALSVPAVVGVVLAALPAFITPAPPKEAS